MRSRWSYIAFDDATLVAGDSEDNFIYIVELDSGEIPNLHFGDTILRNWTRPDLVNVLTLKYF